MIGEIIEYASIFNILEVRIRQAPTRPSQYVDTPGSAVEIKFCWADALQRVIEEAR